MKRTLLAASLMICIPAFASPKAPTPATPATPATPVTPAAAPLASDDEKASYSIGFFTGRGHEQNLQKLNADAYIRGFRDAYSKSPVITEDEMRAAVEGFKQRLEAEIQEKVKADAEANKAKSAAFLAENGKKAGVTTTASGLQYEVLTQGTGDKPSILDNITVDYVGTLVDGTVFDSSIARGEPASFQLDQVIPGWTEGLQLMSVGGKYRFVIPAELAYGDMPNGPIPPNSALIFEVTLLKIEKAAAAPAEPAAAAPAEPAAAEPAKSSSKAKSTGKGKAKK